MYRPLECVCVCELAAFHRNRGCACVQWIQRTCVTVSVVFGSFDRPVRMSQRLPRSLALVCKSLSSRSTYLVCTPTERFVITTMYGLYLCLTTILLSEMYTVVLKGSNLRLFITQSPPSWFVSCVSLYLTTILLSAMCTVVLKTSNLRFYHTILPNTPMKRLTSR